MEGERPPFLLPTSEASMRRAVDRWFEQHQIRPRIVGEFEDSALMKVFGQSGAGFFPAPAVIRDEICSQYGVEVFGPVESSNEQFYAITSGRRLRHPAVVALSEAARDTIFVEERE
jgi:LysR family transcriptional activator of nhaA